MRSSFWVCQVVMEEDMDNPDLKTIIKKIPIEEMDSYPEAEQYIKDYCSNGVPYCIEKIMIKD